MGASVAEVADFSLGEDQPRVAMVSGALLKRTRAADATAPNGQAFDHAFIASTELLATDGGVIKLSAWDVPKMRKRWISNHNIYTDNLPKTVLGKIVHAGIESGLDRAIVGPTGKAMVEYVQYSKLPMGQDVKVLYDEGSMEDVSVRWDPITEVVRQPTMQEVELYGQNLRWIGEYAVQWELSAVILGADPGAVKRGYSLPMVNPKVVEAMERVRAHGAGKALPALQSFLRKVQLASTIMVAVEAHEESMRGPGPAQMSPADAVAAQMQEGAGLYAANDDPAPDGEDPAPVLTGAADNCLRCGTVGEAPYRVCRACMNETDPSKRFTSVDDGDAAGNVVPGAVETEDEQASADGAVRKCSRCMKSKRSEDLAPVCAHCWGAMPPRTASDAAATGDDAAMASDTDAAGEGDDDPARATPDVAKAAAKKQAAVATLTKAKAKALSATADLATAKASISGSVDDHRDAASAHENAADAQLANGNTAAQATHTGLAKLHAAQAATASYQEKASAAASATADALTAQTAQSHQDAADAHGAAADAAQTAADKTNATGGDAGKYNTALSQHINVAQNLKAAAGTMTRVVDKFSVDPVTEDDSEGIVTAPVPEKPNSPDADPDGDGNSKDDGDKEGALPTPNIINDDREYDPKAMPTGTMSLAPGGSVKIGDLVIKHMGETTSSSANAPYISGALRSTDLSAMQDALDAIGGTMDALDAVLSAIGPVREQLDGNFAELRNLMTGSLTADQSVKDALDQAYQSGGTAKVKPKASAVEQADAGNTDTETSKTNTQGRADDVTVPEFSVDLDAIRADDTSAADDKKAGKEKYGDVEFADQKYSKYPIDTKEHVVAALSYIGMEKNQKEYSPEELAAVKAKIHDAAKKFGIDASDDGRSVESDDIFSRMFHDLTTAPTAPVVEVTPEVQDDGMSAIRAYFTAATTPELAVDWAALETK